MPPGRDPRTKPEDAVAAWLRKSHVKFRRYAARLPGRPGFVLIEYRAVIFVHGCFWHGHRACRKGRVRPRTRADFWRRKIEGNIKRDARAARRLRAIGFAVLTIWECRLQGGQVPRRFVTAVQRLKRERKASPR